MKTATLRKDGFVLVQTVDCALTLSERLRGLLGRRSLGRGALLIRPCSAIHTCFMRFDLDLVFFARDGRVVRIVRRVPPFRFVTGGRRAGSVLELESGWFPWNTLAVGDRVELT